LTGEEKDQLRSYWELFLNQDPRWQEARGEWLQMSEAARNTLVENLIRYMSDSFNTNQIEKATRASAELVLLDRIALETLVAVLMYDKNALGLRTMAARCLVSIGPASVPGLIQCLESPRYRSRYLATRALGMIHDERGLDPLIRMLTDDDNFGVRREAAIALSNFQADRAGKALCRTLEDSEPMVVEKVITSLGKMKYLPCVPRLVEHLARIEKDGSSGTLPLRRRIRETLQKITSLDVDSSLDMYRSWKPEQGK